MAQILIRQSENPKTTNDIILKVRSYGGNVYYGGEKMLKIECNKKVAKELKKEIEDMLN